MREGRPEHLLCKTDTRKQLAQAGKCGRRFGVESARDSEDTGIVVFATTVKSHPSCIERFSGASEAPLPIRQEQQNTTLARLREVLLLGRYKPSPSILLVRGYHERQHLVSIKRGYSVCRSSIFCPQLYQLMACMNGGVLSPPMLVSSAFLGQP